MASERKRSFNAVYAVVLMLASLCFAVLIALYAWTHRTQSSGNAVVSVLIVFFFLYCAAVFLLQTVRSQRYERSVNALGLRAFDWKNVEIARVVASEFGIGQKAFLSNGVSGEVDGSYVYLFDIASDTAWWSKRRMVAVLKRGDESALPEHISWQILEKSDAELRVHPNWLVVVSRHSVPSNGLAHWLSTVVGMLKHADC